MPTRLTLLHRRQIGGTGLEPAAPVITGVPTILGAAEVGLTLSALAATVTGSPTPTRTWQWYRGATLISGATTSAYTPVYADLGATLTVKQTETNPSGSVDATSAATAAVILRGRFDFSQFQQSANILPLIGAL